MKQLETLPLPTFQPAAEDYKILWLYRRLIEEASNTAEFYSKKFGQTTGQNDPSQKG